MSDSVRPQRRQPTRLPRPWDSPGKNSGVGCYFLLQCIKVKSESEVAQSCLTLCDPMTAAFQAPPSMGFSRQEYWSWVPLPSPTHNAGTSQTTKSSLHILAYSVCSSSAGPFHKSTNHAKAAGQPKRCDVTKAISGSVDSSFS